MANKIDERIKNLEERLKQAKQKKKLAESREKSQLAKKARSDETRRKILIGSVIMKRMENNEQLKANVIADLSRTLTRDDDRALFDIPPVEVLLTEIQK